MAFKLKLFGGLVALGAGLFFYIPSASAQTADELASKCQWIRNAKLEDQAVSRPQDFDAGECWGYFRALQSYSRFVKSGTPLLGICAPSESRLTQFIKIFVNYVELNPQRGHEDAAIVALNALEKAFPCSAE